ncbi:GDSL-type esterase/lipase family protein [Phytohabitans sp. ZYX-F-186]|uniref:GDSL-type esterase/lipase family protein n=1 Tax=Phytohabitans maris TaxID=3071409 RepID=A0ABU0ZQK9_9ACTN|nr:SGNH/GDSL hydrolase family protein [Phytohabitans sp. ZYX-F-186]MDQ7909248.1 GDSL-type esterase/lipase family protein [Phytohabitans sp. ZYX-F-186]
MRRRWTTILFALAAIVALACEEGSGGGRPGATTTPSKSGLPSSMAALGDSITTGLGSCITFHRCGRHSWSTGESGLVNSHYRRLRGDNKAIKGNAHNFAEPGARAADLPPQADKAVDARVEYVTVLIGANDICRARVEEMTPVADFRRDLDDTLGRLKSGLPKARVLVVSIPDLNRLWEVGHTEARAVKAWARGICPALLANPTSNAGPDAARRATVAARVDAYNAQLAAACKAYGRQCVYDGGAAHRVRFNLDMINRVDWFHPDSDGQRKLSEVTYPRRFAA